MKLLLILSITSLTGCALSIGGGEIKAKPYCRYVPSVISCGYGDHYYHGTDNDLCCEE
jgi:hypothetical protein